MKTVLAHGCFDLLHVGHLRHLQKAAALGDRLVVSVTADRYVDKGPGRPLFSQNERMELIAALRFVHGVTLTDAPTCVELIKMLRPNIYVKGPDYQRGDSTGNLERERNAVESVGGRLVIVDNDIVYSSTAILTGELLRQRIVKAKEAPAWKD